MSHETPSPSSQDPRLWGVLAEFDSAERLIRASEKVRDAGFQKWDSHTPYPVHGLDKSMGINPTLLPWLVLGGGIAGALGGLLMQWWTNAVDYKFVIAGKPFFSLPANIPIAFETTMLLAALVAVFGMFGLNMLPRLNHPLFSSDRFKRATDDGFFISIEADDAMFDLEKTTAMLIESGGQNVEEINQSEQSKIPTIFVYAAVFVTLLALVPVVHVYRARALTSESPRIHLIPDMDSQPKFKSQAANSLFADGRAMRPHPEGTVARGALNDDSHFYSGRVKGQWATAFPVAVDERLLKRGQERFRIFCSPCHGLSAEGNGMVAKRGDELQEGKWTPPPSFHEDRFLTMPVGQYFHIMTHGIRNMPAYGSQVPEADRWAIISYIRALQRSRNASLSDVPPDIREGLQ